MKSPINSFLTSLFLSCGLFTAVSAQNETYTSLASAVRHPADVKRLEISADNSDMSKLKKQIGEFTSLEAVKVRDGGETADWASFLKTLSACRTLNEVEFSFNTIDVMPDAIRQLRQVKTIVVWGNSDLNYDDFFQKLATLPNLERLELSGTMMEQVPHSIAALQQLKSLSIGADDGLDLRNLVTDLHGMPNLTTLGLEVYELSDLPPNLNTLAQLQQLELGLLREEGDLSKSDDHLFVENLAVARPADPGNPLHVKCMSNTSPLSTEERKAVESLSFAAVPATLKMIEGIAGASPFDKKYNYIKPPIAGVDVPKTIYTLEANAGGTLVYPTGTAIDVPADAFVDAKGSTVRGPVKIDYREFRDPVDFIVSGIPMTYDSGGVRHHFESAGMFEINASANGQEVFLAPDKKVELDFALTDSAEKYSFYKFDDQKGNWDNIGSSGTTSLLENPVIKKTKALSNAWLTFRNWKSSGQITWKDTTTFADRFTSPEYFYTKRIFNKKRDAYVTTRSKKNYKKKINNRNLVRLARVKSDNKGELWFKIDFWATKHPELSAYNGVKWVCSDNLRPAEFRKKYGTAARFSDIRIVNDGEEFTLQLKGKDGIVEMHAAPHIRKNLPESVFWKNFRWRNRYYTRTLARRERGFNRTLRSKRCDLFTVYTIPKTDSLGAMQIIRNLMSADEKKMSAEQWGAYYKEQLAINSTAGMPGYSWEQQRSFGMYKRSGWRTALNVLTGATIGLPSMILATTLRIASLGTFNCDRIMVCPLVDPTKDNSVNVLASYEDQSGTLLKTHTTYILNRDYNGMLTYQNPDPGKPQDVRYGKVKGNLMLALDEAGNVYYFTGKDFKNEDVKNQSAHMFKMRSAPHKVLTAEDLRQVIYSDHLYDE